MRFWIRERGVGVQDQVKAGISVPEYMVLGELIIVIKHSPPCIIRSSNVDQSQHNALGDHNIEYSVIEFQKDRFSDLFSTFPLESWRITWLRSNGVRCPIIYKFSEGSPSRPFTMANLWGLRIRSESSSTSAGGSSTPNRHKKFLLTLALNFISKMPNPCPLPPPPPPYQSKKHKASRMASRPGFLRQFLGILPRELANQIKLCLASDFITHQRYLVPRSRSRSIEKIKIIPEIGGGGRVYYVRRVRIMLRRGGCCIRGRGISYGGRPTLPPPLPSFFVYILQINFSVLLSSPKKEL